jgi:hypothetical protein
MTPTLVRRSFIAFHLVLGIGLLALSVETLLHALAPANLGTHKHIAAIAGIEGLGAILFLIPRTLRPGAVLLLITVGGAFLMHGIGGSGVRIWQSIRRAFGSSSLTGARGHSRGLRRMWPLDMRWKLAGVEWTR